MGGRAYFFPADQHESEPMEPQIGNPAKLVVVIDRPNNQRLPDDLVGTFVLHRNSQLVIPPRGVFLDHDALAREGTATLTGYIDGSELASPGTYQWQATVYSVSLDATFTLAGDFRFR
jgi:hypothetical protein